MRIRTAGKAIVGVAAMAVTASASVAFACTISPQVSYSLQPESASPGQVVTVEGRSVSSTEPVEIRWNGAKGDVLATATAANGSFSVPVKIPAVSEGIYSLMLVTADAGVGRTAIQVIGAPSATQQAQTAPRLWPTDSGEGSGLRSASSGGPSPVGVSLLAVGLVGLFAGSTVAVVRRRRVVVESQRKDA